MASSNSWNIIALKTKETYKNPDIQVNSAHLKTTTAVKLTNQITINIKHMSVHIDTMAEAILTTQTTMISQYKEATLISGRITIDI